ncbi:MAG: Regulator of telomere elongation helicase 1, variant 2 [Marteilia pararefringens]
MNNGQQQLNNNNCSDANHSTSAPKVSKTCATPFDKDYDNIRDDENYYQEQFDADDDDDCKLLCHNLLLRFPKPPYDVQKKIVERIIYSLNQKKNILIESPTGTGKTLSLLCSTLAWLRSAKVQNNWPKPPKIIYATRTHSQISQLIGEIKKTAYSDMKICFLASREQLCINDRVMNREKKGSINSKCRNLVSSGKCIYKSNVGKENSGMDETKLFDIEELKIIGKQKSTCPYYYTREIALQADLIFMPYNYILEKAIRQRLQIDFDCSIIVFDEAHNVEKTCEDGFSLKICGSDIALAMHEITDFANHLRINFDYFKNRPSISDSSDESSFKNSKSKNTAANSGGNSVKSVDWTDVAAFKRVLCILEYHIKEMGIGCKNEFKTLKAQVLYDHVIGANFTQDTAKNFFILDECIKYHNSDLNSTLLKGFGSERILNLFEFFHQGEFGSLDDYIVIID